MALNTSVDKTYLDNFTLLREDSTNNNTTKFYCPLIDSGEFNYDVIVRALRKSVIHYCLSRRSYEELKDNPMEISYETRNKFRNIKSNDGELGELMMFSFLESDLNAPKILTKMELKTNPKNYFNGADGVHYLKIDEENYQLIFGESKAYTEFKKGYKAAIDSIEKFKNDKIKDVETGELRGITFEKSLLNAHLTSETFSEDDKNFIKSLIYPKSTNKYNVDTAFGVFILFDFEVDSELKKKKNAEYRKEVHKKLEKLIDEELRDIYNYIDKKDLSGHCFYFYLVPIERVVTKRKDILKEVIQ